MKITDVEAMVLDTGKDYGDPAGAAEAHGVRFISLIRIRTDEGITGWSDVETQPHVGRAIVQAPSGGQIGFESLQAALVGEEPLERERLWQKMYRYVGYYGRQGAGMQMMSGADVALWDIAGKALWPLSRIDRFRGFIEYRSGSMSSVFSRKARAVPRMGLHNASRRASTSWRVGARTPSVAK